MNFLPAALCSRLSYETSLIRHFALTAPVFADIGQFFESQLLQIMLIRKKTGMGLKSQEPCSRVALQGSKPSQGTDHVFGGMNWDFLTIQPWETKRPGLITQPGALFLTITACDVKVKLRE